MIIQGVRGTVIPANVRAMLEQHSGQDSTGGQDDLTYWMPDGSSLLAVGRLWCSITGRWYLEKVFDREGQFSQELALRILDDASFEGKVVVIRPRTQDVIPVQNLLVLPKIAEWYDNISAVDFEPGYTVTVFANGTVRFSQQSIDPDDQGQCACDFGTYPYSQRRLKQSLSGFMADVENIEGTRRVTVEGDPSVLALFMLPMDADSKSIARMQGLREATIRALNAGKVPMFEIQRTYVLQPR